MKNLTRWIVGTTLPVLFLVAACRDDAHIEAGHEAELAEHAAVENSVTLTPGGEAAAHIQTEPAATRTLSRRVAAAGEIEFNARRLVHLTARTPGRVERVLVVDGDRVPEGQVLARMSTSPDYLTLQANIFRPRRGPKRLTGDPAERARPGRCSTAP